MKIIKYLLISLGGILILAIAVGSFFLWKYYKSEQKNRIISLVKKSQYFELHRTRMARSGLLEQYKDKIDEFEKEINKRETIEKPFTIHRARTYAFNSSKKKGTDIGPFIWDVWKLDKNKWLVGGMWAELDDTGTVADITGSFFEVRIIKDQELIRWLLWQKNDNDEYFDPLTKKYADRIDEIKKEYIKFWKD